MTQWSMSRQLQLWITSIVCILWLAGVTFAALSLRHEIDEVFDSSLQETAQRILPLAAATVRERNEERSEQLEDISSSRHKEYLVYQVRNAAGQVVVRSHDAPLQPFRVPLQQGFYDDGGRRYFTEVAADSSLAVQVAELPDERFEAVRALWLGLIVPLAIALPLAAWAILLIVKKTLQPVVDLQRQLRQRDASNVAPLQVDGLPDELQPMAADVNKLLTRLGAALDAERAFAANSAHELRNPIAAAQAQASIIAQSAEGEEQKKRATGLVASLATLGRKIEALLQLARTESGLALSRERMSLRDVVALIVGDYERKPQINGRIIFSNRAPGDVVIMADADALGIAVQNVMDNALKHSPAGTPIYVTFGPGAVLSVRNDCALVPQDELERLKQRFVRGVKSSQAGSGIGLYIADTIIKQSGGDLTLYSPARQQSSGFEVVIKLPAVAAS